MRGGAPHSARDRNSSSSGRCEQLSLFLAPSVRAPPLERQAPTVGHCSVSLAVTEMASVYLRKSAKDCSNGLRCFVVVLEFDGRF